MQIQVLLSMGQDRLSKEEAGELLDQRVNILTFTQELHHLTRNFCEARGGLSGRGKSNLSFDEVVAVSN